MIKFKVKSKKNNILIKVKIPSDLVININQCNLLSKKFNRVFLQLNSCKNNKLRFTGPLGISLYKRFKTPISEYDFFFIMEQFIDVMQKLEKIGLSRKNLIMDLKYIFFNETVKELSFVYVPITTPYESIDILSFIEQLIYSAKPTDSRSDYLSKFSYFIKNLNEFDADKIESYIYLTNKEIVGIIKNIDVGQNNSEDKASIKADDDLTALMEDDDKTDIMEDNDDSTDINLDLLKSNILSENLNKVSLPIIDDDNTILSNDETELFMDGSTDLLDDQQEHQYKYPSLVRVLTNEIIRIDKPVFRIGKQENCVDYIVSNNVAISHSHADIISRGDKYFVFDLRSKNKSYINNRVLPAEHEVEIFNGDILKLANEEFLFQV